MVAFSFVFLLSFHRDWLWSVYPGKETLTIADLSLAFVKARSQESSCFREVCVQGSIDPSSLSSQQPAR
jgi:hypothetical protein